MGRTAVIYSDKYLEHETGLHCEASSRLIIAIEALRKLGILPSERCQMLLPKKASVEDIRLIHSPEYIEEIRSISQRGGGHYDGDTVLSKMSFETALLAAGGAVKACEEVASGRLANAYALVRPPGHHAGVNGRALGAPTVGFCLFNNIAIAAAYSLRKHWADRILIIDFDVHQGNGTQEAFNYSSQVFYVSLHERGIYPGVGYEDEVGEGEGAGYTVNIPLPPRSDDEVYIKAFKEIIMPVAEQFNPELVLVSAGYDAHHTDSIAEMLLTVDGFVQLTQAVLDLAMRHCNGRVIMVLEGGYSSEALSKALPATVATMAGIPLRLIDVGAKSPTSTVERSEEIFGRIKKRLREYWEL